MEVLTACMDYTQAYVLYQLYGRNLEIEYNFVYSALWISKRWRAIDMYKRLTGQPVDQSGVNSDQNVETSLLKLASTVEAETSGR